MSRADALFIQNCRDILDHGVWDTDLAVRPHWEDGTPAHTVKKFGIINRYRPPGGVPHPDPPADLLEDLRWTSCCGSGRKSPTTSTTSTATSGTSGRTRTAPSARPTAISWAVKHHYPEGDMDQVDRVLYDLKHNPASRRILTSLYNFQDLHEMNLYPCAYSMTFNVSGNVLNAILNQRSQDMLAANNWNVVQYAVLVHMLAQVSGLVPGELVHVIADAHIYDRHVPIVEKMLERRRPRRRRRFIMDPSVTDFYAFTRDSFSAGGLHPRSLRGQNPHRHLRRPTAVNAIVVVDRNWAIGRDNDLLFSLPTDMRRFRSLTLGGTVILGRRTLDSFPGGKPLPQRRNIVITRCPDFRPGGGRGGLQSGGRHGGRRRTRRRTKSGSSAAAASTPPC